MSIPGYATPEQTAAMTQSPLGKQAYTTLGRTGLTVSRLGFGTYRCDQENPQHKEALQLALRQGGNLIDTSANYTNGASEALVGEVLNEWIIWENMPRETVVVVSKVGYIQGENLAIARQREQQGDPFPEVVKYQPGLWHCLHPDFIDDQVTRSLSRMHLDTLDVYLLHNPEYFLMNTITEGMERHAAQNEFYHRLKKAFIKLEQLVKEGLIRYYGISSNGFPLHPDVPGFVDLGRVWRAYQDACLQSGLTPEEGHFAVIQLPYNWLEPGAFLHTGHSIGGPPQTVLETARQLGLGVLINRPLNAIANRQLVRLARYDQQVSEAPETGLADPLCNQLEERFNSILPELADRLTLSQKAIKLVLDTPGVDGVLNGMRHPDYVRNSLDVFTAKAAIPAEKLSDLFLPF